MVEFIVERFGEEVQPRTWKRWSDQCASQFNSRFTMHKLSTAPESLGLQDQATVVWQYFETGEGKNLSDTVGAIVKAAYQKAAGINRDTTARSAAEIIELIKTVLCDDMKTGVSRTERDKTIPSPNKEHSKGNQGTRHPETSLNNKTGGWPSCGEATVLQHLQPWGPLQ